MFFKAVFKPDEQGAIALDNLLREKPDPKAEQLRSPMNYRLGHAFRVSIDVPDCGSPAKTRDECFKTAEWAKHRNGFSDKIPYTVAGYDDDLNIIYLSYCPQCKAGKLPHYEHE